MVKSYVTGFPRIGEQRELKKALENFWNNKISQKELEDVAKTLRKRHWQYQIDAKIDLISVNDFSFYDLMLDHIVLFGAIPQRFSALEGLQKYFAMARGTKDAPAMEMTKWFNTNYHYIVPELSSDSEFHLNSEKILSEYKEAVSLDAKFKINLIGPITFLALSKSIDDSEPIELLDILVDKYCELLSEISKLSNETVIQIEEPIFVSDKGLKFVSKIAPVFNRLSGVSKNIKIIFMTYFENANEAVKEVIKTDIWGIGLDFVYSKSQKSALEMLQNCDKVLFAGLIDGRNVWRSDLKAKEKSVDEILKFIPQDRLYIGTSCSLLHVPFTLKYEDKIDPQIKEWLSFAVEKLREIKLLSKIAGKELLLENDEKDIESNLKAAKLRKISPLIHNENVTKRIKNLTKFERSDDFKDRIRIQHKILNYGILPTTTIGSFPQISELRQVRKAYKKGLISQDAYEKDIKAYIDEAVKFQEEIGLDILVHGEPERNDMVEYFGEQLSGYAFSANGWVQSYGSRCVKPPLLFGDVNRPKPMTVKWITYAQSKTKKIMKGMLTGPVTIMNWSFVRDDKPKEDVVTQIALAICDEIDDLQNAGIKIIQVDEAAFKEGYPLRNINRNDYEKMAVGAFKLAVSAAEAKTQIHTHMCYSDFNDIIKTIEAMDADVISIETARSGNKLLKIFSDIGYKQEIGPGVYDIHSPRVPSVEEFVDQIRERLEVLPKEQLWINPDCGLKTRKWPEVKQSLKNMVEAVKIVRGC